MISPAFCTAHGPGKTRPRQTCSNHKTAVILKNVSMLCCVVGRCNQLHGLHTVTDVVYRSGVNRCDADTGSDDYVNSRLVVDESSQRRASLKMRLPGDIGRLCFMHLFIDFIFYLFNMKIVQKYTIIGGILGI